MSESGRLDGGRFEDLPKGRRRGKPELDPAKLANQLPPHAAEAEPAVLGCVLVSQQDAATVMNTCEERGVTAQWFYDLRYQTAWVAMAAMHGEGKPIDTVTLQQRLKDEGHLEELGGLAELMRWPGLVPSAANVEYYLELLEEKWLLRSVAKTGTGMVAEVYSVEAGEPTSARQVLARAEQEILRLGEEGQRTNERAIKAILWDVIQELEDYHRGHAQIRGISCGLEYFDKLAGGIGGKNGYQWVIAARPGVGKTSFAMQWAEYAALEYVWWDPVLQKEEATGKLKPIIDVDGEGNQRIRCERRVGVPVGVFSLEMTATSLVQRMIFSRARADLQRWRTGYATSADLKPLEVAVGELGKGTVFIDDVGRCTIESLRAKARRMHRQHGIKLFVVDYLQLLRSGRQRRDDRVQELTEISGDLFALGKELGVPFLILAQMNRDFEKEPNREPRLSDLKDCGAIEQDADLVGFLHYPKLTKEKEEQWDLVRRRRYGEDWSKAPSRVNLLVSKYRHGPSGKPAELLFERSSTRFLDYYVWLKSEGEMQPALGEQGRYPKEGKISEEDVQAAQEMFDRTNPEEGEENSQ